VSSWRKLVKCGINSLRRPMPTGYLAVWLGCPVISRRLTAGDHDLHYAGRVVDIY
jgi:hypothetical protein